MTGSVNGGSVLLENQFVGIHLHVDTMQVLSVGVPFLLGKLLERGQSFTSNRL